MKTNTGIVLYHKVLDKNTRLDKWISYKISHVMWQGGKGANINKGYVNANDISIFIPYNKNENLKNIPFAIGDIIVKGNNDKKITKQSDLEESFNITTLINNNYGSYNMQHIQIGAK